MSTADIVILVFLFIGAYSGYKKGLLMELISLGSFFVAIIVGIKLLDWGVMILSEYISGMGVALPIIAFAIIFIGVIILLNLIGKTMKQILDMTLLGKLDDLAGAVTGVVKWALFVSIFIWAAESFAGFPIADFAMESYLYGPISVLAPGLFGLISGLYPSIMDLFENSREYLNEEEIST